MESKIKNACKMRNLMCTFYTKSASNIKKELKIQPQLPKNMKDNDYSIFYVFLNAILINSRHDLSHRHRVKTVFG